MSLGRYLSYLCNISLLNWLYRKLEMLCIKIKERDEKKWYVSVTNWGEHASPESATKVRSSLKIQSLITLEGASLLWNAMMSTTEYYLAVY